MGYYATELADDDLTVWRIFYSTMHDMMKYYQNENDIKNMMLFSNIKNNEDLYPFAYASKLTGIKFILKRPAYSINGKWLHGYRALFIDTKNEKDWIDFAIISSNMFNR